jgi:signal transduction histidine kinase
MLVKIRPRGFRSGAARLLESAGTPEAARIAPVDSRAGGLGEHVVQFHERDESLLDTVTESIGAGLLSGDAGLVIATGAHRAEIERRLRIGGVDLDAARAGGQYIALDATETLAKFSVDGVPEPERFVDVIGAALDRAGQGERRVRAFGEMVMLLATAGNFPAAIRLEQLWNELQQSRTFSLHCAYSLDVFDGEAFGALLGQVCAEHSRVIPAESYSSLEDPDDRLRAITLLQQKAASLEAEIAERKQAEQAVQALLRISQKLHATVDLEQLLDQLVVESLELVGAEGGCAGLRTPDGLVCQKYFRGAVALSLELRWPAREGIPGWLLEHRVPYLTNDARQDLQIQPELCQAFGLRSVLSAPILDLQGEVLGFIELHNRTDRSGFTQADREKLQAVGRIASLAIQNARLFQESQEAVQLRDQFLSIASHELRTPLTTVGAQAQLMLRRLAGDGVLEAASAARSLGSIADQTRKLASLVDQLLDVSRLQTGRLTLDPRPVDLSMLVEEVAAAVAVRTMQQIELRAPETLEANVDPLRLDQLLTNLLDNAIKFAADSGPIQVALATEPGGVEISVRDHGPGIPEAMRPRLFERFFQAHARGYLSGMGLGLYLCHQIAELHGGRIWAEFPEDGGTRMVVRLPDSTENAR